MNESVVLPAREAIHSYVANVRFHLSDLPSEELDELVGVGEPTLGGQPFPPDVAGRVPAEGEDVANPGRGIRTDDATQLRHRRAHTRQVRQGHQ